MISFSKLVELVCDMKAKEKSLVCSDGVMEFFGLDFVGTCRRVFPIGSWRAVW